MNFTKKTLIALLTTTMVFSMFVGVIIAPPTGVLRIDPPLPYMNESPAEFTIWVQGVTTACDPIILLVMTDSCYQGLNPSSTVTVEWEKTGPVTVSVPLGPWTEKSSNGDKIPELELPLTVHPGAGYTVASLKDHLGTSESIWYAWAPILEGNIVPGETYEITVNMDSTTPEMLVYIMGKSDCGSDKYDMAVPPTIPGFVVPEVPLGTVLSLVSMLGTAALYRFKRK